MENSLSKKQHTKCEITSFPPCIKPLISLSRALKTLTTVCVICLAGGGAGCFENAFYSFPRKQLL